MKEAIKQKWISALRSDMYKQCSGSLAELSGKKGASSKPNFCVLGVLAEISGISRELDEKTECYKFQFGETSRSAKDDIPTVEFARKVGLTSADMQELYERNDSGESFKKLANYIEKNL